MELSKSQLAEIRDDRHFAAVHSTIFKTDLELVDAIIQRSNGPVKYIYLKSVRRKDFKEFNIPFSEIC